MDPIISFIIFFIVDSLRIFVYYFLSTVSKVDFFGIEPPRGGSLVSRSLCAVRRSLSKAKNGVFRKPELGQGVITRFFIFYNCLPYIACELWFSNFHRGFLYPSFEITRITTSKLK